MPSIRQLEGLTRLKAAGTSEGVKKAWESRQRRKVETTRDLRVGDYVKIASQAFPYKVSKVHEEGVDVDELRPYHVFSSGTIKHRSLEDPEHGITLLTKKKDLDQAHFLEERQKLKMNTPMLAKPVPRI